MHYPAHINISPAVYTKVNLIFAVLLETVLLASGVIVFSGFYNQQKIGFGEGFSRAFKKYLPLIITSIVIYVVFYLLGRFVPPIFTQSIERQSVALDGIFISVLHLHVCGAVALHLCHAVSGSEKREINDSL